MSSALVDDGATETCDAIDPVTAYRARDFLFCSSHHTLHARGCLINAQSNRPASPDVLDAQATTLFEKARRRGQSNPIIVGALPFDVSQPAHLYVPEYWRRSAAPDAAERQALVRTPVALTVSESALYPRPQGYREGVKRALQAMAEGRVDKIVLSRTLEINASTRVDLPPLMKRLIGVNPHGYSFALPLTPDQPDGAPPHAFIGASPELLVKKEGTRVVVNPLAGSIPRHRDTAEDQQRAEELAVSEKDLHEHKVVIDAILEALTPYCSSMTVPEGPSVISTDTLWHLSTTITGELRDPAVSSLALAAAMHPTPAVCGHPRREAYRDINAIESFHRGHFGGAVGWCDSDGNGEWSVAIRCADVHDTHVRLYAGAGLVPGSDPQKELIETGTKLRTMLNAMGLEHLDTV
ncbi:isochorismate synthase [Larsenimonas rhizosphaerae]|uniref:isochorismate synthase n=1 Tax=Larsenimonas rhizosphaerae TaxID=2944682 RepID=A0AA41ZIH5_9GAMM|nr:isochorismate synthase [Larsenimonas rhizosphaerae]MCM2129833.1 isochorismate synthase [Larsenimonas rhizosphaerae]MCX2524493.1 isochorismate synthase [Larsenimonas rhizosphaerae]